MVKTKQRQEVEEKEETANTAEQCEEETEGDEGVGKDETNEKGESKYSMWIYVGF